MEFVFEGDLKPGPDAAESQVRSADSASPWLHKYLTGARQNICRELEYQLEEELGQAIEGGVSVVARISFRQGSVIFGGVIQVIATMSDVSGAIGLVQIVRHAIRRVVDSTLRRHAPGWEPTTFVAPRSTPRREPISMGGGAATSETFLTLRTALLWITLLNAALFIGGSVYTGISINSIQERYHEAAEEIQRVRADYEEYRDNLTRRVGDIEGELRETATDLDALRVSLAELEGDLSSLSVDAQELRSTLDDQMIARSGWISIPLVVDQASWPLRIVMIIVILLAIGGCVVALIALKRRH